MSQLYSNESILSWLKYFADNTQLDLERLKMLDITKEHRSLIPTVESHKTVLVFTEAGDKDIFYHMWEAGLGECDVWYNEGSEPAGEVKCDKLSNMINRKINASAAMLIVNNQARNTYKIGMDNALFRKGSIHYVGSEIRAVILNKMNVGSQDDIVVISGESIAIEAAMIASEGSVTAVEYKREDRETMEENIDYFGLDNIHVVDHVGDDTMAELPVPSLVFMVASATLEKELDYFTKLNPNVKFVVYTLDFNVAANIDKIFESFGIRRTKEIQISVSVLKSNNTFEQQPAPWLICGEAQAE